MFIHDKLYADPTWNKTFLAGANLNDFKAAKQKLS
jgi:hypothetical protein